LFERIGSSLENSKDMYYNHLVIGIILSLLAIVSTFVFENSIGTIFIGFYIFYIIADYWDKEDKFGLALEGFLKTFFVQMLLGFVILIVFLVVLGIPLVFFFFTESGVIAALIFVFAGLLTLLAYLINLFFIFVPFYLMDGFSMNESIKYSFKAVREYNLYWKIIGGGLFFTIITSLVMGGLLALGSMGTIATIQHFEILTILTGLLVSLIGSIAYFRILLWGLFYYLGLYEDTNNVAL